MTNSNTEDTLKKKTRKPRQRGGFAVAEVDRTATGSSSLYVLTVRADDFDSRKAARAHLRLMIENETWPSKDVEYSVVQIKDLGLKPHIETKIKITGV